MKAKHIYDLNYVKEQKKRWIVDYTTRDIAKIQKGTVAAVMVITTSAASRWSTTPTRNGASGTLISKGYTSEL